MSSKNETYRRERFAMRCSQGKKGCGARFILNKRPEKYLNTIRCPHCNSKHVTFVEKERDVRRLKRKQEGLVHICPNVPFPHTRRELRYCIEHPLADVPLTEEEMHDYQRMIETKRGSFT